MCVLFHFCIGPRVCIHNKQKKVFHSFAQTVFGWIFSADVSATHEIQRGFSQRWVIYERPLHTEAPNSHWTKNEIGRENEKREKSSIKDSNVLYVLRQQIHIVNYPNQIWACNSLNIRTQRRKYVTRTHITYNEWETNQHIQHCNDRLCINISMCVCIYSIVSQQSEFTIFWPDIAFTQR